MRLIQQRIFEFFGEHALAADHGQRIGFTSPVVLMISM